MRPRLTPEEVLGSRSRIAVLRVLWRARRPLNASQIAADAGLTRPAVATVLKDLADAGVVVSSSAGRANIHTLNRSSVYVERMVAPLFEAETELPDQLLRELRDAFEDSASAAVLFGSYARGDQVPESDLDVVLVAEDDAMKAALEYRLPRYEDEFRSHWGVSLSVLTYTAREAGALWRSAPSFLESLSSDGLVVFGKGPWEWAEDE